uniref:Ovomucoid n=1 Tax=Strigops habroptila TaxID=2489341 RepID=A0A672U6Y4_STRHB
STISSGDFSGGNEIDCSEQNGNNLACAADYSPLCGSDGRTYGNQCHFCNAVLICQSGEICREFVNRSVYCTRESNPHCGTDGITYGNKCAFCKAVLRSGGKIRLKHLGKC